MQMAAGSCQPAAADRQPRRHIPIPPFDFMGFWKSIEIGCSIANPFQWISLIFVKCRGVACK